MRGLFFATTCAVLACFALVFFFTPEEASQGIVQKIFYIHVSSAITMYLGFFLAFLSGIMFFIERKLLWDEWGSTAAEVAWVFCTSVLLTGPAWAKPIWGTWWTWEPRLTTTFLLWLLYSAYLFVRNVIDDSEKKATVCAALAIIAFIDVPLIHYSVKLWRGIHPTVIGNKSGLPVSMKTTLTLSILTFFLFFVFLWLKRYRLEKLSNELKAIERKRFS